ncbi:hypothetical protein BS78_04G096900 [Paspalum vaginatum]|nr:hypothetical protein BS78_04G096900 [Paspalum vaginatum]
MLYFRGYHTSGQLLTLDEVKEGLPSDSLKVLSESKWTFVTQEEHSHLSKPWFTLHPCATSDWMKLLEETKVADKEQSLQYLQACLSVVGQALRYFLVASSPSTALVGCWNIVLGLPLSSACMGVFMTPPPPSSSSTYSSAIRGVCRYRRIHASP